MIPDKIHLEIVTPVRRVFEAEVSEVVLPGAEGSFGVLPGHAPMLTGLAAGVAVAKGSFGEQVLAINDGFAEVTGDRVLVMAETCEKAEEIDTDRAKAKVEECESQIKNPEADPEIVRLRMLKHLARLRAKHGLSGTL